VSIVNAKGEEINKGIKNEENLYEVSGYKESRDARKYVTPSLVPNCFEGRIAQCLQEKHSHSTQSTALLTAKPEKKSRYNGEYTDVL